MSREPMKRGKAAQGVATRQVRPAGAVGINDAAMDPVVGGNGEMEAEAGLPPVPEEFTAGRVMEKVAKLLRKPGISRSRLFHSQIGRPVYAYFADPENPKNLVREDKDGNQVIVRLVGGRFRVQRTDKVK